MIWSNSASSIVFAIFSYSFVSSIAHADSAEPGKINCTVAECANRMLEMASKLITENAELGKRVEALEDKQTQLEGRVQQLEIKYSTLSGTVQSLVDRLAVWHGGVLGAGVIKGSQVISVSAGATFDPGSGIFSFPNPTGLKFAPIVSSISANGVYQTEDCYSRVLAPNSVVVWQGGLDEGGGNHTPRDCTIAIVGLGG